MMAIEAVDLALVWLLPAIDAAGGVALITARITATLTETHELDKKTKQLGRMPTARSRPRRPIR